MSGKQRSKLAAFIEEGSEKPSPELCEHLGSKAAQLAIDANINLSDAVVKVASDQSGLNNNHINNICWEANNEYFRKVAAAKKEAGGEDLAFNYALADPPDVAKRLNAAANPKVSFVTDPDFLAPPPEETIDEDALLRNFFGSLPPDHSKKYAQHNALKQLGEVREVLVRASDQTREKAASLETGVSLAEARLYKLFKQAAVAGTPLGHIVDLLSYHHDGDNAVAAEVSKLAHKLSKEEPLFFRQFQKTANVEPEGKADTEHPLYHAYSALRSSRLESAYMSKAAQISTAEAQFAMREEAKLVGKHIRR
jgi:hypothetical protein